MTDSQLLEIATTAADEQQAAAAALALLLSQQGVTAVALLRPALPNWETVATSPAKITPPHDLAADALDSGDTESAGNWTATVLDPAGCSTPYVLLVEGNGGPASVQPSAQQLGPVLVISRRRRQMVAQIARLQKLLDITHDWRQANDLTTLLGQIAEAATELFDCDRATLFLWDQATKTLVGRPALGVDGGELRVPEDAGLVGQVLASGQPRRVSPDDQQEIDRRADEETGYRTHSLLGVPLETSTGHRLGVFELINKRSGGFTDDDVRGLSELAHHAAAALGATQEFESLLERQSLLVDEAASGVELFGECSAIAALRATIERVANTDLAILILGENGCGKEVVARSLHYRSQRREAPFVAVNCAALAETLLESELFGHEAGAFTDAREARAGKFEVASGGTLLLDEIGDMSLGGQAKLLRVLEDKTVVRVGGSLPIETDVRVLAATNKNLAELVRQKKFREDLYFRLNVVSIELPPLRDRGDDIVLLAEFFMRGFCQTMGRRPPKLMADAKKRLLAHRWPGNIRELRNLMERLAYLSSGDRITADELAFTLSPGAADDAVPDGTLNDATREFQTQHIRRTIKRVGGSVTEAAKLLGVHRSNLYRKMRQLGMSEGQEDDV